MALIAIAETWAVDLFCLHRKFLVFNLVQRNLKLKYRQSALGVLWTLLAPALNAAVYYLIFSYVMKVQIPHYLAFVLSGLLPWMFFVTSITQGMESIAGSHALINKVPLPLNVFPLVETITNFINYIFAIPVLIAVVILNGAPVGPTMLIVPFYLTLLFFQTYGFCLLLGVAYVFFRDLRHVLSVVIQMWMYATPIIYTSDMIPQKGQFILWLNPTALLFDGIHSAFAMDRMLPIPQIIGATVWSIAVFVIGTTVFYRYRSTLVEGL